MHRPRPQPGFTIIEMLVVITVIAALMAILIPTLTSSRESARRVVCLNNLRSLGLAVQMHRHDHDGALPYANNLYSLPLGWTDPLDALGRYLDVNLPSIDSHGEIVTHQPFRCPSDPGHADATGCSYAYLPSAFMGYVVTPDQSEQKIAKEVTTLIYQRGSAAKAVFRDMGQWHPAGPKGHFADDAGVGRNSLRFDNSVGWSVDDDWR